MSLKEDIELAFYKSMHPDEIFSDVTEPTEEQKGNIPDLAENLSIAIIEFLKKQEFKITDMKAVVEMEEIGTTSTSTAAVKETTLLGEYGPLIDILKKIPGASAIVEPLMDQVKGAIKLVAGEGVTLPKFNLKKEGGQGGAMKSRGYAYIGTDSPAGENNEITTIVKLKDIID